MLGNPACATTSLFGTQSCQVMPKILLRQRRWKVLVGVEGPGLATIEQRAQHAGLVYFHLLADGQHGVVPDPLSEKCQYCFCLANSFVQFSV